MMRRRAIAGLVVLALLAACGPVETVDLSVPAEPEDLSAEDALAAEREALARCGDVDVKGYCGVDFGMPVDQALGAFPVKLEGYEAPAGADLSPGRCHELFATPPVMGVSFLAEGGVIGRIDVLTEAVRTADDFGVGTQASDLRAKFGDALGVAANALEPDITDLSITQGAAKFVFEIQDGAVRAWRAGTAPTIDYVAHCG